MRCLCAFAPHAQPLPQSASHLAATNTVRVPEVFHYGPLPGPPGGGALRGSSSFIVMECLDMRGRCDQGEGPRCMSAGAAGSLCYRSVVAARAGWQAEQRHTDALLLTWLRTRPSNTQLSLAGRWQACTWPRRSMTTPASLGLCVTM